MNNRTKWIIGCGTAVLGGIGLLVASRARKNSEVKNFYTTLGSEVNVGTGDGSELFANLNAWDPKMYIKAYDGGRGVPIFNQATADMYAKQIYDAKSGYGWFGTEDEDAVFDAFRRMGSLAKISQVSAAFSRMYKTDMQQYVTKTLLNTAEVDELMKIIQKFK